MEPCTVVIRPIPREPLPLLEVDAFEKIDTVYFL